MGFHNIFVHLENFYILITAALSIGKKRYPYTYVGELLFIYLRIELQKLLSLSYIQFMFKCILLEIIKHMLMYF